MKKQLPIIIDAVLAVALIALYVFYFAGNPFAKKPASDKAEAEGELMHIAVVNTDSILKHYTFAIDAQDQLMNQYEESTLKLDTKAKTFQKEYETFQQDVLNFQRKLEAGAFLSRERAESEQARLQKKEQQLLAKQQELENLRQQLANDFMEQQADLTQQLQDSVQQYLRELNSDGHYHLILNDAVLLNQVEGYDITEQVIEGLNARSVK
ncbi:MAG: OmpH family outer membrane protein [Paludibacteraceae bacterium]|nr:OmpH family outer membrane protein [Paludibacteraceae bacterium]